MFNKTELDDIVNNAPEKSGIFSSHCLKHVAGCIEMLPYSTASYLVNELNKEPVFHSHYIDFWFTDGHGTDIVKFEKVKVQNSVRLKYKFYEAILKVSSLWRGFSWSTKLDSRYTSEAENNRGALLPIITTWSCDFDKYLYLKYLYMQMCR